MPGKAHGPFAGAADGAVAARRVSYPPDPSFVVRSDTQAKLISLADRLKFFTRHQAVKLLGRAAEKQLKKVHRAGYLDRLVTGKTPPVYTAGPALGKAAGIQTQDSRMPGLFRTVAANQLYVALGGVIQYEATGEEWPTAVIKVRDRTYWVLAPRLWPKEDIWLDSATDGLDPDTRLIVVAPSEMHALDAGPLLAMKGISVRYTWDTAIKDSFCLFRYTAYGFVPDEKGVEFFTGIYDNKHEGASPSIAIATIQPKRD